MTIDPDNLTAAIHHRRTIKPKEMMPDPVDRALVERVLEAARWAPCHGKTEPWRFVVFQGDGQRALADAVPANREKILSAPVWIAIAMQPGMKPDGSRAMPEEEEVCAVACAVQNMHLTASSLGLGAMWSTGALMMSPEGLRASGVQPPARVLGWLIIGWPAVEWPKVVRKPVSEIARWIE